MVDHGKGAIQLRCGESQNLIQRLPLVSQAVGVRGDRAVGRCRVKPVLQR
jgi:hypothetical protein